MLQFKETNVSLTDMPKSGNKGISTKTISSQSYKKSVKEWHPQQDLCLRAELYGGCENHNTPLTIGIEKRPGLRYPKIANGVLCKALYL